MPLTNGLLDAAFVLVMVVERVRDAGNGAFGEPFVALFVDDDVLQSAVLARDGRCCFLDDPPTRVRPYGGSAGGGGYSG